MLSGLVLGTLFAPTFWLSLAGGLAAVAALGLGALGRRAGGWLAPGPVGLSVLAACAHIQAQFWLAWSWFIPHPGLLGLLPLLQGAALAAGLLTGLLAARILEAMQRKAAALPAGSPGGILPP